MSIPNDGLQQSNTLTEGQTFEGRYQILAVLGRGGVGVVYKARQLHLDKIVAIKTLLPTVVSDDRESFQRFEQEARTASALDHPNIIRIFDFGKTAQGLVFLVMEYLGDQTLEHLLVTEKRLDVERFLRLSVPICDGLYHAHKSGVIHRDIKPSNIMISKNRDGEETVKVVDFGLAKLTEIESAQNLTKTGTIVGTPLYMSPEQCRGLTLDHRSDIYSLACVFYATLTGHVPIHGATALDTLYQHTAVAPQPFNIICPGLNLPPQLEKVILKALEKNPELRQQSMAEFRNDIHNAIFDRSFPAASVVQPLAPKITMPPSLGELAGNSQLSQTLVSLNQPVLARAKAELDDRSGVGKAAVPSAENKRDAAILNKAAIAALAGLAILLIGGTTYLLSGKNSGSVGAQSKIDQTKAKAVAPPTVTEPPLMQAQLNTGHAGLSVTNSNILVASVPDTAPRVGVSAIGAAPHIAAAAAPRKLKPGIFASAGGSNSTIEKIPVAQGTRHPDPRAAAAAAKQVYAKEIAACEQNGRNQMKAQDWANASRSFDQCMQLQRRIYGNSDYRLFPTYAHLINCQLMLHRGTESRTNLLLALEIFAKHRAQVMDEVQKLKGVTWIWRTMARASFVNARDSNDAKLLGWSVDFYELCRQSFTGAKDSPECSAIGQEYSQALEATGNIAAANKIRQQFDLPILHVADDQKQADREQKHAARKSLKRIGRMEIRTYR